MQQPYVIGICGGSGSGKSTLVHHVRQAFTADQICLLTQDDFYFPKEKQEKDENGVVDFDRFTSIDHALFHNHLASLISGKSVSIKEYVFNNKDAIPSIKNLKTAPIILVEGLFVLHNEALRNLFDLKVYVETKDALKVIRRINRDQTERNYPISDVLYRYQHHVLPSYLKYIAPHKEEADLIVNNNNDLSTCVNILTCLIRGILAKE